MRITCAIGVCISIATREWGGHALSAGAAACARFGRKRRLSTDRRIQYCQLVMVPQKCGVPQWVSADCGAGPRKVCPPTTVMCMQQGPPNNKSGQLPDENNNTNTSYFYICNSASMEHQVVLLGSPSESSISAWYAAAGAVDDEADPHPLPRTKAPPALANRHQTTRSPLAAAHTGTFALART